MIPKVRTPSEFYPRARANAERLCQTSISTAPASIGTKDVTYLASDTLTAGAGHSGLE